ncbi:MAG: hypothetical protein CMB80_03445 [Flammeovirgaceae bacterium]|jgi:hypothetical protein|nr:hypothetical protein [Flammeovirgaceae bacterium]|tara:strand:+ start:4757 stop:5194 length:438 start_codon:yes stop_codon:yes gene_type:complete
MFILTEKKIIRMLRSEYRQRLLEVVNETDVFDDRGNMIIGKDLKVRHKKSQYEYTVDDVLEDPKTGDVQIALRMPEDPRIAPEPPAEEIISDTNKDKPQVLGEQDPPGPQLPADAELEIAYDSPEGEEEIFFIDQDEFEKEYEVK